MAAVDGDEREGACELCGLSLAGGRVENDDGDAFCCAGCRNVHATLDDVAGIDESDVRASVVEEEDAGTGAAAGSDAKTDATRPPGHERAFLQVDGMHCTTCERFVRSLAVGNEGVSDAEASYVTETVRVDFDPDRVTAAELAERLSTAGYTAYRRDDAMANRRADDDVPWRLVAGVMLGMMVMLPYVIYIYPVHFGVLYPEWMLELVRQQLASARYFYYVLFLFASAVLFYTGGPLLRGAYVSLRAGQPNMDLLVSLAAVSAYLYSALAALLGRIDVYFDVTVAIVVVVTAGTYYESSIKRRATALLSELTTVRVDEARRYRDDGATSTVDVDDLEAGDRVLVRAGERVPVDGVVCDGDCTVDEAVVTGESLPVVKEAGDDVVGGSVLTDGAAVIEVDEGATSSVDRVVNLVWDLQSSNHGIQKLADKLSAIFVPGVVTVAVVAGAAYLALGADVTAALLVALTVLIVSCPCALGLATPLAVASGIREAMERGVVVFDETVFERIRDVDVVAFDKTGTLTTADLDVLEADAPADLLDAAAALERRSSHPVADAIVEAFGDPTSGADEPRVDQPRADASTRPNGGAAERGTAEGETAELGTPERQSARARSDREEPAGLVTEFRRHPTGVEGVVDGTEVLVGHPDLFDRRGWSLPEAVAERATDVRASGRLPVVVGRDGAAEGVVVLGDEPREGWAGTVTALSERDVEVVILTGDEEDATSHFRRHPHVDEVFAGLPPEAKAETVRRLGSDRTVAMVGDGTNDGPALASADLGIALGSGTALAVDAADVAIVNDDLASIETVFRLSTAAGRRVKQNIGWAFLYNAVAIPLAILGYLNPLFAAAAMATSSLLVVTNSSRDLLDEGESEPSLE